MPKVEMTAETQTKQTPAVSGFAAVGVGITNACNLTCSHCYSCSEDPLYISKDQFSRLIDVLKPDSINLGTGESYLHPEFFDITDVLLQNKIKASLTSNGLSVLKLPTELLGAYHDIDISIDFPTRKEHDQFRGDGAFSDAIAGLERCLKEGVEVSIVSCMMSVNTKSLLNMRKLLAEYGVTWRINIYKPVRNDHFVVDYDSFWNTWKALFEQYRVVAVSEPILAAFMDPPVLSIGGGPCGQNSIRIRPTGEIAPCVYWTGETMNIFSDDIDLSTVRSYLQGLNMDVTPDECIDCDLLQTCGGGCIGRRRLYKIDEPDTYCPIIRGDNPTLSWRQAPHKDLVHASYLCTAILTV